MSDAKRAHYLWVCTKRRPDDSKRGSCAAHRSEALQRALKSAALAAGVDARVCSSGCFDLCWVGASVAVMPDNVFLKDMTVEDAPALIEALKSGHPIGDAPALASKIVRGEDWIEPTGASDE
jgi:(2Fe-2S) ferredoxin